MNSAGAYGQLFILHIQSPDSQNKSKVIYFNHFTLMLAILAQKYIKKIWLFDQQTSFDQNPIKFTQKPVCHWVGFWEWKNSKNGQMNSRTPRIISELLLAHSPCLICYQVIHRSFSSSKLRRLLWSCLLERGNIKCWLSRWNPDQRILGFCGYRTRPRVFLFKLDEI